MSTIQPSPSNKGRVSETWSRSWTHLSIDRRSPSYCRVTFDHPPINTIDRVRQATKERGIDYPVAVDNKYEIWSAVPVLRECQVVVLPDGGAGGTGRT